MNVRAPSITAGPPGTSMGIAADGLALNSGYAPGQLIDPEQVT